MARLDRYILSQLMGPFALFALILIGIYWIGRAIGLFDQLIGDGQSITVFLEIMLLFLPQVVAIVLPVVSFAAAIYVSNRLHSESEMVVMQAAGFTPARMIRPFVIFGLLVAVFASTLSHYLVPVSQVRLDVRQREMAQDMASRLIVGGRFLHPSDNVTFFVREIDPEGGLLDIFLHDQRPQEQDVTYTAHKAILFRNEDDARLVMFDGLIQTFDKKAQLLSKIQFDEFVFDIGTLTGTKDTLLRKLSEYSTFAALFPTEEMLVDSGLTVTEFRIAAHKRIEQPLQSLVYPMIGMAVLMLGSFSRFGVFRQVLAAIGVVVALSILSVPMRDMMRQNLSFWWMIYVPDLLGLIIVYLMLRKPTGRTRARARAMQGVAA